MTEIELLNAVRSVADCLSSQPEMQRELASRLASHLVRTRANQVTEISPPPSPGQSPVDFTPLVAPHLTPRQQQVWDQLMQHRGIRQIGRDIGISHVAVIKHRRHLIDILFRVLDSANGLPPARHSTTTVHYESVSIESESPR